MKKGIRRICPKCGGKKDFYAAHCRGCAEWPKALLGRRGPDHPTWKGGFIIDRDGYIRTYAPDHPWPRKGGYVLEHVRLVELAIGRRLESDECVHHVDHDKQNNDLANLQLVKRGEHSAAHRAEDHHLRERDALGRFASKGGDA